MYEGIPVLHVGQHGAQGPNIQVSCLSQGEASADGPVIYSPLQAVTQDIAKARWCFIPGWLSSPQNTLHMRWNIMQLLDGPGLIMENNTAARHANCMMRYNNGNHLLI